jgi:uncharacterized repeat protein (TIGR03803 family)
MQPFAALILDGAGNLYGTTGYGGSADQGTVFRMKTDGTGYTVLHHFAGAFSDGAQPTAELILDGAGNLYGTTYSGGSAIQGTVFTMKTDGTGFRVLHDFPGTAFYGAHPDAALILDGAGNLYGTTRLGGSAGHGTVFTMKTNGTGFTVLHNFSGAASDGIQPYGALILDRAGNLYGTTYFGGSSGRGTVFTMKTNGTGFRLLHSFAGGPADEYGPLAALILDAAGNLYGTTYFGGSSGNGTVFTMKTDGTGFTVLHPFPASPSNGGSPQAPLILDGAGNLYGTTHFGGSSGRGTVFTLPVAPPAATLIAPTGTITTTMPPYSWNAVATATWYYHYVVDSQRWERDVLCAGPSRRFPVSELCRVQQHGESHRRRGEPSPRLDRVPAGEEGGQLTE